MLLLPQLLAVLTGLCLRTNLLLHNMPLLPQHIRLDRWHAQWGLLTRLGQG